MRRSVSKRIICWGLLLYLAVFMIPPVSSFAETRDASLASLSGAALAKDHRQTTMYLYDLLLWQSLKNSRHSGSMLLSSPEKVDISAMYDSATLAAGFLDLCMLPHGNNALYVLFSQHSRSADIRFIRSGISPPFLS